MNRAVIGVAVVTAILLWLASPVFGAGWLAWVALVPSAAVVLGRPGTLAARVVVPLAYVLYLELLLVPALPFGLAEGQWGDAALPVMVGDSPVLPVALVAIPLFGALLYVGRFGEPWGAGLLGPRLATFAAILVPALAWTALDLVRTKLDPGGSWGPLFLSQAGTPGSELAALGGPWLVTLAVVSFNYGLALAMLRRRLTPALVPAAVITVAIVATPAIDGGGGRATVTVAAIQPGYDTAEDERRLLRHWHSGSFDLAARDVLRDLGRLTARGTSEGAELVVWPEAVAFVDLRRRRTARARLREVARSSGATIVAPYFDHVSLSGAAIAVSPGGSITGPRPKQRPMWFLGEQGGNGQPPYPLRTAGLRVGTLLGVDIQDPGLPRLLAARDAELITSSTHDWRQLATEHRALARFGAEASGAPVVKADWRYGSAIYDRDGNMLADAGPDRRRTAITAAVELGRPTPYARIGDVVGWVSLTLAVAVWLAALVAAALSREVARVRRLRKDPV